MDRDMGQGVEAELGGAEQRAADPVTGLDSAVLRGE